MKRDINSRTDAKTKDMEAEAPHKRSFNFPTLKVTVEAETYEEALEKAKKVIRKEQ